MNEEEVVEKNSSWAWLIIVILVLIVAAALYFLVFKKDGEPPKPQFSAEILALAEQPNSIKMNGSEFSPKSLSIKAGNSVNFVNLDTEEHWPASDDHPSHQIYSNFDPRRPIKVGESWSFKFDKAGTWGCHDHLFPNFRCSIVVEP